MSPYSKEKLKKFYKNVMEEYNQDLIIENIVKVTPTEITDGKFIQVGIRPVIDEDIFIQENFDERLPGAGRWVAIGERDFLIYQLLQEKEIKRTPIKKEEIKDFLKHIESEPSTILISTNFHTEILMNLSRRIDYDKGFIRLDKQNRLIFVPDNIIGNRIIIIPKDSIYWKKKLFQDPFSNEREKIEIKIGNPKSNGKVDVTIKSLNKIELIDKERIKILELIEDSLK